MSIPGTWSEAQPAIRRRAPRLGEHTLEVLREAGLDQAQIDAMVATGAVRAAK
jgi:crotonobetainyl-CoA:carnitine CoA-transferase CaiB-like acyl-CoA transferase